MDASAPTMSLSLHRSAPGMSFSCVNGLSHGQGRRVMHTFILGLCAWVLFNLLLLALSAQRAAQEPW
jgi:hypothetical protein